MYNKTNNLSVDMMIDLTIQINFMYKHNVTDLVCIGFYFDEWGPKKPRKMKKRNIKYPHYRHKTVV